MHIERLDVECLIMSIGPLLDDHPSVIRSYPSEKVGTVEDEAAENSEYTEPDWPLQMTHHE